MWERIKKFFKDSETIFLARLQAFAGLVLGVFLTFDPSLFQVYVPAKYVPIYLLGIGVLTEVLRRRRTKDM